MKRQKKALWAVSVCVNASTTAFRSPPSPLLPPPLLPAQVHRRDILQKAFHYSRRFGSSSQEIEVKKYFRPNEEEKDPERDTIRVRIWRALASGEELSLSQLCKAVGESSRGELRSHLTHVEKQAKTIRNKSDEWRIRRGLPRAGNDATSKFGPRKMQLKMRKGDKNEVFIKLV